MSIFQAENQPGKLTTRRKIIMDEIVKRTGLQLILNHHMREKLF